MTGTSTPTLSVSPSTTLTFPSTTVGQSSATQAYTFTNSGTGTLTLGSYTLSGATTSFTETTASTCGSTTSLTANQSCTLVFAFTPQSTGTLTETIAATDNTATPNVTLTLTGTGVSAVATNPTAVLLPNLTFPSTSPGSTSAAQVATLTNSGTAALTIAGLALGGTNPGNFTQTNNCGTTLAVQGSCSISITFTPTAASTTYTATLTATDNSGGVTGSTQSITLIGAGASLTPTALAILSPTSLTFASTAVGSPAGNQTITLSNPGNATLTGIVVSLGGTNASSFSQASGCNGTLPAGNSCNILVNFTPTTTGTLTATLSVADNVTGSPQTATLTGTGKSASTTVSYQFYVFGPPGVTGGTTGLLTPTPLYTLINGAQKTVDMTMYELQDTVFSGDLVADCARGVKVRVVLSSSEASNNNPAYVQLNTAGSNCSAVLSNTAFTNTHQKTITVDNATTAVLSLNLQTQYYSTSRDFAMVYNDPVDIAAIEATFAQDYAAGTPYGGSQGASDFSYQPGAGTDLIWSPTTAQAAMLALINNAKSTLLIENEEMSASNIVSALETACGKGVSVHIAMVNSSTSSPYSSYATNFKALEAAGCGVRTYPDTTTGLYIHAKAVIADYGLSTQSVYMGSINYSNASMTANRELGMYITDVPSISTLYTTMTADYTGATTF